MLELVWVVRMTVRILVGDVREQLATLADGSVHCVVTSPPYWGLRDYGVAGQIGLEATPAEYLEAMTAVFREVRRVLRADGTCWVNMGDSYAANRSYQVPSKLMNGDGTNRAQASDGRGMRAADHGYKPKDLVGMPWRLAFALQADGWYLRQDIIWCLSGGAWVYARTQKGDMPVMVKDLVRLKPSTVKLWNGTKWTQVLGWGASNDTSQRLELVLRSGERIGCTGGHLWPTQRGNVAARDLRPGDVIQTCRLPEPATAGAPMYLTRDLLWLIGLYLAEGSRAGDTIQLSLNADEAPWLERIEATADGLGASMTHTKRGGNLSVRLYGRVLAAAIEEFIGGRTAHDKHLRAPSWNLPGWALRCIAGGYLDGDGHWDQKADRWRLGFARNYALERDLRTLAARLGAKLTLHPGEATYQGGKKPSFRGEWRWNRTGHHNEKDRGEVVEIRASRARKFWDIAVEDEPHLFALASGVLTHNCKPNPMPESVRDRCTKAHEYIFLLSKSERYFFDQDAISEPASENTHARRSEKMPDGWATHEGGHGSFHKDGREKGNTTRLPGNKTHRGADAYEAGDAKHRTKAGLVEYATKVRKLAETGSGTKNNSSFDEAMAVMPLRRNKRSVWTITTKGFSEAHFATFPPDLPETCIKAGCPPGGTVLDPFFGAGTTGLVADRLGRECIGIELNPAYAEMARRRIQGDAPLLASVA